MLSYISFSTSSSLLACFYCFILVFWSFAAASSALYLLVVGEQPALLETLHWLVNGRDFTTYTHSAFTSSEMKSNAALALGIVCAVLLIAGTSAQVGADFDFFYFVVQWPGSYCDLKNACCYPQTGKPASNFSIHGLWPNYDDGTYPSNCDPSDPFDYNQVEDLVPQMDQYWGSLSCPSSDSTTFWAHEWEKHGTCSGFNQHDYFSLSLALLESVDLLGALEDADIAPSGSATYQVSTVQKALAGGIGYTPGVECNIAKNGNTQLYQVYICVDKDGETLIPCPLYPNGKCQAQVHWPTF